jgi:hypothetical protein
MVEQLEKAKAYVAEIEKAQENKEAKTKETIKPKKQTKKKTTKKSEGLDKNQASSKTATDIQKTKLNTNTDTSDMVKVSQDNAE